MQEHIGVRVAASGQFTWNFDAAQFDKLSWHQAVQVVAMADAKGLCLRFQ
jgi:hypothetical protein